MIKLIVSDIDGTLVRDGENKINQELFDVIMRLKKEKQIHSDNHFRRTPGGQH